MDRTAHHPTPRAAAWAAPAAATRPSAAAGSGRLAPGRDDLGPGRRVSPAGQVLEDPAPDGAEQRRRELAAFLRSRRERLQPEDIGLPPGARRRTPGLRREEVALDAGVGVTWYTWLEQGRSIRASQQVLDALARTLRLDRAERDHLYRLAELPLQPEPLADLPLPDGVRQILAGLDPLPAILINSRFDVLLSNPAYDDMFSRWHDQPCAMRNLLWCVFAEPDVRARYLNFEQGAPRVVAQLRSSFANHLGEPAWTGFIQRLTEASPAFAEMWSRHEVASPGTHVKTLVDPRAGVLRMTTTSLAVADLPEHRILVYTPADQATHERLPLTRQDERPDGRPRSEREAS